MDNTSYDYTDVNSINDDEKFLSDRLLQILNEGVNRIVEELQEELGNDRQSINQTAKNVLGSLNELRNSINTSINNINGDVKIQNAESENGSAQINSTIDYQGVEYLANTGIQTLDDEEIKDYVLGDRLDLSDKNNRDRIQTRLNNCQTLEVLYLKKHEELMKTFAFTINLFDKYKYSINMILYLLKNLVKKELPDEREKERQRQEQINRGERDPYEEKELKKGEAIVQLPLPILKNVGLLIKDKNTIGSIISSMNDTLGKHNITDLTKRPGNLPSTNA
jgi:hypothetical protein